MTSKQDRQGVRTAADLEQKYHFGKVFQKLEESIQAVATGATEGIAQLKGHVDTAVEEAKAYARTTFSNDNLLDNWNFGNPRNTNGQSSYSGNVTTIDGWYFANGKGTLTINDGYISLSASSDAYFTQEVVGFDRTKTYTISATMEDGTTVKKSGTDTFGFALPDGTYFYTTSGTGLTKVNFKVYGGTTSNIKAVKLEYGSVSTLANDEPPKCSEQIMESYQQNGSLYRIVDGVKEWINPPMVVDTEYRTAERWNGSVVYTKLVNVGKLPNAASMTVTISGATGIKSIDGYITNGKYDIPIWAANAAISNMYFTKSSGELNITTNADRSTWTCYLTVKYIK